LKKTIFIAMMLFIAAGFARVDAQVKIAFVDSDAIIKQLPEAQAVQKKMEDLQKQYLDTISGKESEIKSKAEDFKAKYEDAQKQIESGKLSGDQAKTVETQLTEMQNEIQRLDQDLAAYKQGIQQTLVSTQSGLFKPVKDKITKVIEDVAKEMKYNIVLDKASDALIYGDKDIDITFKILDKLK
jgi:outer membrane protein